MNQEYNQESHQNTEPLNTEAPNEEILTNDNNDPVSMNELVEDVNTSKNAIIIAVLAIIVVVLTLMYMWGSGISQEMTEDVRKDIEKEMPLPPDESIETLKQVGTSDDINVIEEDLLNTEVDMLDKDFVEIEAELDAELTE